MKTNHTPGPWLVIDGSGPLMSEITSAGGSYALAKVFTKRLKHNQEEGRATATSWPEGMANAHLIKAAPDLLVLLKRIEAMASIPLDELPDTWKEVQTVIASAEGRAS